MPLAPRSDSLAATRGAPSRPSGERVAAAGSYRYRRLESAELPLLNDLYNACYRAARPLAEAEWLYARNPNGAAVIFAAFDAGGRLAGVRPAIPFRQTWRGIERTAYEFADALVDPADRGRGIFSRLVRMVCAWAEEEGHALYSIPNENSLPIYQRSPGLAVIEGTVTRARPLAWRRYFAAQLGWADGHAGAPAPAGSVLCDGAVRLRPVGRFESDFADVRGELEERVPCFTVRTRAFLQWRYFGSPVRQYRAALIEERGQARGYIVLRLIGPVAQLVDVFMRPDPRLARRALALAAEWARRSGAAGVHFNASAESPFHAPARLAGYWLSKRSGRLVLDRASAAQAAPGGAGAARECYFVMGDFDFL